MGSQFQLHCFEDHGRRWAQLITRRELQSLTKFGFNRDRRQIHRFAMDYSQGIKEDVDITLWNYKSIAVFDGFRMTSTLA